MKSKWKQKIKRALSVALMSLVIAVALYSPTFFFGMKDLHDFSDVNKGKRDNFTVKNMAERYEQDLLKKLNRFSDVLNQKKTPYVMYTEGDKWSDSLDEGYKYVDYVLLHDTAYLFADYSEEGDSLFSNMGGDYQVLRWKKFTVYDESFTEGVYFLLGYLKVQLENDIIAEYLIDTETYDVYYMRYYVNYAYASYAEEYALKNGDLLFFLMSRNRDLDVVTTIVWSDYFHANQVCQSFDLNDSEYVVIGTEYSNDNVYADETYDEYQYLDDGYGVILWELNRSMREEFYNKIYAEDEQLVKRCRLRIKNSYNNLDFIVGIEDVFEQHNYISAGFEDLANLIPLFDEK